MALKPFNVNYTNTYRTLRTHIYIFNSREEVWNKYNWKSQSHYAYKMYTRHRSHHMTSFCYNISTPVFITVKGACDEIAKKS